MTIASVKDVGSIIDCERRGPIYSGLEDQRIGITEAASQTGKFRKASEIGSIKGAYFGANIVEMILANEGVVGIRVYLGSLSHNRVTFIMVGVDQSGTEFVESVIGQHAWLCPPWCSERNQLNSSNPSVLKRRIARDLFTGFENHEITFAKARELVRCRLQLRSESETYFFGQRILSEILAQSGSVGIRLYFGRAGDQAPTLIVVGVERDGSDKVSGIIGVSAEDRSLPGDIRKLMG